MLALLRQDGAFDCEHGIAPFRRGSAVLPAADARREELNFWRGDIEHGEVEHLYQRFALLERHDARGERVPLLVKGPEGGHGLFAEFLVIGYPRVAHGAT